MKAMQTSRSSNQQTMKDFLRKRIIRIVFENIIWQLENPIRILLHCPKQEFSNLWSQNSLILLKLTENSKELLFIWIISIDIHYVRN